MRDLNRRTASVLEALERGESFEVRRRGRAVGYLTRSAPPPDQKPDWKAHFDWLRRQSAETDASLLKEFEAERRRLRKREKSLGNLP